MTWRTVVLAIFFAKLVWSDACGCQNERRLACGATEADGGIVCSVVLQ